MSKIQKVGYCFADTPEIREYEVERERKRIEAFKPGDRVTFSDWKCKFLKVVSYKEFKREDGLIKCEWEIEYE